MKIYIASFFETRERLLPIRERLQSYGHEVTARWLDEGKKPENWDKFRWWQSLASKDLIDINRSDTLVLDTLDVNPRGGREVEWGFAFAQEKYMCVVGPLRNVFHTLNDRQFKNWDDALGYFHATPQLDMDTECYHLHEPWIADPVEEARKKRNEEEEGFTQ